MIAMWMMMMTMRDDNNINKRKEIVEWNGNEREKFNRYLDRIKGGWL